MIGSSRLLTTLSKLVKQARADGIQLAQLARWSENARTISKAKRVTDGLDVNAGIEGHGPLRTKAFMVANSEAGWFSVGRIV